MPRTNQKTNPESPDAPALGATKTWQPPSGEQGLSNRANDGADDAADDRDDADDGVDGESSEEAEAEVIEQLQAGSRPRREGGDPVADSDPNAEDASLATDADGLSKVQALKDETERPSPKDQDAKGAGGRESRRMS